MRNITDPLTRKRHRAAGRAPAACTSSSIPMPAMRCTVVTAPPPARGFIRRQDFVEFSLLETVHGVVVQPNADDVKVELDTDRVTLGGPAA